MIAATPPVETVAVTPKASSAAAAPCIVLTKPPKPAIALTTHPLITTKLA